MPTIPTWHHENPQGWTQVTTWQVIPEPLSLSTFSSLPYPPLYDFSMKLLRKGLSSPGWKAIVVRGLGKAQLRAGHSVKGDLRVCCQTRDTPCLRTRGPPPGRELFLRQKGGDQAWLVPRGQLKGDDLPPWPTPAWSRPHQGQPETGPTGASECVTASLVTCW